jgi:VanZ family protein
VHKRWLTAACAVSALVILWAPFVGEIRSRIRAAFPGHFVLIVGSAIAVVGGAAVLAGAARIRDRRMPRYLAIVAAFAIAAGYSFWSRTGRPDADVVERVHFVEFGVITYLFYRAARPLGDVSMLAIPMLAGLLVGTLEEWLQWFIPVRVGELRDIFLNGAAIVSGLLFSWAIDPPPSSPFTLRPASLRRVAVWTSVVTLAIAAFFQCVHLGYEIADDRIGTFRSRYTTADLAALAVARAARWRGHPPPLDIPRLSREDQYLTEGIEHVMERNRLWAAGDLTGAWHENRILEKHFTPVIDTPSYHAKEGTRWPAAQRDHATAAALANPRRYVSRSNPAPIHTWSKAIFWSVVAAVAAVIAAAGTWLDARLAPPE